MSFGKEKITYCKYCGLELEKDTCTCEGFLNATRKIIVEKKQCDTCKKKIDIDAKFCPYCGIPYGTADYEPHLQHELMGDFEKDVLEDVYRKKRQQQKERMDQIFTPGTKRVIGILTSVLILLVGIRVGLTIKEKIDEHNQKLYLESIAAETTTIAIPQTTVRPTYDVDETIQPEISLKKNWIKRDGFVYCLDKDGNPAIDDWVEAIDENGDSNMYYFDIDGRLVVNSWIDGEYYVGPDGAMFIDKYTPDGAYVDEDGRVVVDEERKVVTAVKETRVYYEQPDSNAKVKTSNQRSSSEGVIKGVEEGKEYELYIKSIKVIRGNYVVDDKKCNYTYYYPVIEGGREKEVKTLNEQITEMFTNRFLNVVHNLTDEDNKAPKSIVLNVVDQRQQNPNNFIFIVSGRLITQNGNTEKKKYRFTYDRKAKKMNMLDISGY